MKFIAIFLSSIILSASLNAQVRVMGSVKDNRGRILAGASITLKGTYDGTTSDSVGRFSFKTFEKGAFVLVANNIGNKIVEMPITIAGDTVTVDFSLKEEINELKAVVITAGSYEASDKKKGTVLKALDIATTAGANADISATIQTLPGAQKVGEQEGLFIRGGGAEEAKIIIDGTVVNNFFYSSVPGISQRGRFSPFLFSGTAFSSGGYSAVYGQALSSILSLESIDIPDRSEVQIGLSPIFLSAGLQQVSKDKRKSYGFSYNWVNLTLYQKLVPQAPDFFRAPDFHTADANFRIKTKKNGMFKIYAYFNSGDLAVRTPSLDSNGLKNAFSLNNQNLFTNISYRQFLGRGWKINTVASISYNKDKIGSEIQNQQNQKAGRSNIPAIDNASFNINARQWMVQARVVLDKKFGALNTFRFGTELWNNSDSSTYSASFGVFPSKVNDFYQAIFSESDLYITNDLAFRPGVRMEHSGLLNKWNIAPRAALSYKLSKNSQLTADYGMFYQTPERRFLSNNANFDFLRADHYILTYQHISSNYTFRTQIFYKDYVSLLKTDRSITNAISNNGGGFAKGIEVFWRDRKTFKNFDYWISYSYLDTKRDYNNYPIMAQPTFAANHSGSIVLKKFWVKKMFGVNWSWNWSTGRPFYNPNKPGTEFLSDRTIGFSSNNFSLNWLPKIGKSNTVVVLGINNVFNELQIFGYNYSNRLRDNNNQLIRAEVNPPAPRNFFLGIFMSWGVDRTLQNINGNL
ncbi:MAG: TonB-dependent receptor [Sphingobacteriia bacterium]|nr:MAG: TonB-dependent receptor [Sphingobacteriia bacterium]TAG29909.1 MAG: TonB-dependent receptor [Sphingobacteriia bacterium]